MGNNEENDFDELIKNNDSNYVEDNTATTEYDLVYAQFTYEGNYKYEYVYRVFDFNINGLWIPTYVGIFVYMYLYKNN